MYENAKNCLLMSNLHFSPPHRLIVPILQTCISSKYQRYTVSGLQMKRLENLSILC